MYHKHLIFTSSGGVVDISWFLGIFIENYIKIIPTNFKNLMSLSELRCGRGGSVHFGA